jgi:hypothetical protein
MLLGAAVDGVPWRLSGRTLIESESFPHGGSRVFEIVHTCPGWWDGPREGIANFQGLPHLFESDWGEYEGKPERFFLHPLDAETFKLALEDWAIWLRWETAFHQGRTGTDTHPALPEERERHDELAVLLQGRLVMPSEGTCRKEASFRGRNDASWSGFGFSPLEVEWTDQV